MSFLLPYSITHDLRDILGFWRMKAQTSIPLLTYYEIQTGSEKLYMMMVIVTNSAKKRWKATRELEAIVNNNQPSQFWSPTLSIVFNAAFLPSLLYGYAHWWAFKCTQCTVRVFEWAVEENIMYKMGGSHKVYKMHTRCTTRWMSA